MLKVLIVDDAQEVLEVLSLLYTTRPELKVVGTAGNPGEMSEVLKRTVVDVISLDIQILESNGITVCRELHAKFPQIFITMCSLEADEAVITLAKEAGAHYFLPKPVVSQALDGMIQAAISFHARKQRVSHTPNDSASKDVFDWVENLLHDKGLMEDES